jgi:nitroimidazol reductase NimA-like FMN-containing flavoprotein (pyridoxamine 5'-phosphate oxidase superfamily)
MRRKEKQVTNPQEIDAIIYRSEVCRLAMARDNIPYMVPLSFGYDGEAVYLHTAREGRKIDFFEANPQVCFELECGVRILPAEDIACNWSFHYESVIGFGTIAELVDPTEKEYGFNQVMRHYSGKEWSFKEKNLIKARVWKITIQSLSAKKSTR